MAPNKRTQILAWPSAQAVKSKHEVAGVMVGGGPSASDEAAPALELLTLARELPDASRDSLAAMAPHCLTVPKDERDPYQHIMVDAIARVVVDVDAQHRAAVDEARDNVAKAERELGVAAAAVAAAAKEVATLSAECDAKREASKVSETGAIAAEESAERTRAKLESFGPQRAASVAEQAKVQQLVSETLPLLRMGTMLGHHGIRAERKLIRMVDSVAVALEKLGVEKPVVDAVSATFWRKPDDRSEFSKHVLLHAEETLAEHLVGLDARLSSLGRELAQENLAHSEAGAAVKSARKRQNTCMECLSASEIALCEAERNLHKAEDAKKATKREVAGQVTTMDSAIQRLSAVQSHIIKFEALRQRERFVAPPLVGSVSATVASERSIARVQALAPRAGA